MNWRLKLNSIAVLMLALGFCWFFMFAKHDPALAPITPFGEDPYDAVGSFCMIVSPLLALLALVRALRPYRAKPPAALDKILLARTLIAVLIGIQATLVADAIAMARHRSMWIAKAAARDLLVLMAGLALFSLIEFVFVLRSIPELKPGLNWSHWKKPSLVVTACFAFLAFFPEALIQNVPLHFIAIVLGFALVAAQQVSLAAALVPLATLEIGPARPPRPSRFGTWVQWGLVAFCGISLGTFLLIGEMSDNGVGNEPLMKVILVSCMFIGAGTALCLVAFAFYKKPLGIFRKSVDT